MRALGEEPCGSEMDTRPGLPSSLMAAGLTQPRDMSMEMRFVSGTADVSRENDNDEDDEDEDDDEDDEDDEADAL